MRDVEDADNPFSAAAEERFQRLMMRQKFQFDQGHAALLEHLSATTTEAGRQLASGKDPIDVLSGVHNYIREQYPHLDKSGFRAFLAGFAVAMADELNHCGAHGAAPRQERTNP